MPNNNETLALPTKDHKPIPTTEHTLFDPFIHGTNSMILPLLPKTDMQMLSPVEMIRQYQVAPLSGEIIGGGLSSLDYKSMPAFGRLRTERRYSLEHIIKDYTSTRYQTIPINWQKQYLHCFSEMNILLICLTRDKILGKTNADIFKDNGVDIEKIYEQINTTLQYFYFILLIGKYIHPNVTLLKQMDEQMRDDISDAVYTHLTFDYIFNFLLKEKINVKAIYENPAPEGLSKILELLSLPKTSVIKSGVGNRPKNVTLPDTPIFVTNKNDASERFCAVNRAMYARHLVRNISGFKTNEFLKDFVDNKFDQDFFDKFEKEILMYIDALEDRFALFKTILEKDYPQDFMHQFQHFYANPFPLILICEKDDSLELVESYSDEHRATKPLQFGRDITMVATDSNEHKKLLKEFFASQGVSNVDVVLFKQLALAKTTGKRPEEVDENEQSLFSQLTSYFGLFNWGQKTTGAKPQAHISAKPRL